MGFFKLLSSIRFVQKQVNHGSLVRTTCSSPASDHLQGDAKIDDKVLDEKMKGLVLGVYETDNKFELTPAAAEVDQKSGGKIYQHLNELSSQMKLGKAFIVTDIVPEYSAVAIASYGPKDPGYNELEALDETKENIRWGVGAGVRALQARGCARADVDAGDTPAPAAEAALLAAWRFKSSGSCETQPLVTLYNTSATGGDQDSWDAGLIRGRAQNWARYLSDMPANKMAPVDLAQAALDTLCPLGVHVEAREREWLEAQGMEAFLAVARGACEPPVLLECIYKGGTGDPVLIAAKGVTFDSGGLCLKSPENMAENRGSMAGAAVTLATLKALAQLKVPINVCAVIPLCENMISGECMRIGDVVTALNGLSVQIEDTDQEGRLMLADALVYGQALHRPSLVIDVATFTQGVLLAMGGGAFGCFSNSEAAWRAIRAAGARSGDRAWRLPLWQYYHRQITDEPAVDLRNKGSGSATPCLGAAFLRNFICGPWVHMDITGVGKLGHAPAPPYLDARRMTGRPARTLVALLEDMALANMHADKTDICQKSAKA